VREAPKFCVRLARIALLAGILALPAPAARAVEVAWLYDVTVPVENQSAQARLDAASRALAELLTRLTGLTSVPRNDVVSRALAAPDVYYNQFRFERTTTESGEQGLALRLQFVPQAVLELVRDANLPIWRANRPRVVAWLVVDEGLERRILAADSEHPAVAALQERARERGLPLRLPLMDLADQLAVSPAAVWGRLSQTLMPASERYGADIVLVGRLQQRPGGGWASSFEFWLDGDVRTLNQEAGEPAPLGRAAADLVADELAARYAVLDRGVRRLDLTVSAVSGARDYADLLRYLGGLEFVEQVSVHHADRDRLGLSLITAADRDQLLELFQLDRRLFPDLLNDTPGPDLALVWQRR
jgi:hypothetical protein